MVALRTLKPACRIYHFLPRRFSDIDDFVFEIYPCTDTNLNQVIVARSLSMMSFSGQITYFKRMAAGLIAWHTEAIAHSLAIGCAKDPPPGYGVYIEKSGKSVNVRSYWH